MSWDALLTPCNRRRAPWVGTQHPGPGELIQAHGSALRLSAPAPSSAQPCCGHCPPYERLLDCIYRGTYSTGAPYPSLIPFWKRTALRLASASAASAFFTVIAPNMVVSASLLLPQVAAAKSSA